MNHQRPMQAPPDTLNERLASSFYSSRRYNTVFLAVTGMGFIAIFLLTRFGILGEPVPQLFYVGTITVLLALAEIPLQALAQQGRGVAATLLGSLLTAIFAVFLTLFWDGIVPIALLIALATPLLSLRSGLPRRHILLFFLLVAITIAGILSVDANPPLVRIQNNSLPAVASIVYLLATSLLLATIASIVQSRKFRSVQSLLLTSLILIVTIPILMTVILSAIGAFSNSQTQTFNTLQAIATLKKNQIENLLFDFQNDTTTLLADTRFNTRLAEVRHAVGVSPMTQESSKRAIRSRMVDVLGAEEEAYNEIMVLDAQGEVIVSTIPGSEGSSFEEQPFFRRGTSGFYAGFAEGPSFGSDNLIVATPIFGADREALVGVLVLRSSAAAFKRIMESTPGFAEAETYLVDQNFRPVTGTILPVDFVRTQATLDAILNNRSSGNAIYPNYTGQQVLGHYEWFPSMQLAVIAEVPLGFVIANSARALAGTALLALFAVAIAIAAVAISARTITEPIKSLAQTTERLAGGDLSVRAMVDREDEIGALATAYNQMAMQLQETVSKLEQRVLDRTRDLESQTLRLRVAAEIARDATSARDLQGLLSRAAELIVRRFDYYHIGIFLLDHNKEYAIRVAASTKAGSEMTRDRDEVRIGGSGIVARVAATGEARVIVQTGDEAVPLDAGARPGAQSRMALPLKVENNVIGVLDVQSDRAQAFNEDDLAIMQVMADQLATSIERTRLLQEVESNLRELQSAYGQFTRENWRKVVDNSGLGAMGYRFDHVRLERITELPEVAGDALRTGATVSSNGHRPDTKQDRRVAIPIKLRGQTIGVVSLTLKEDYDTNTISVVESAAERLAVAMESARLYEEARLRADREQLITRVTAAISSSSGYEHILQTTIREIGSILGDTEVAIQILDEPAADKRPGRGEK
jgi:GAF domain-containing protein/HAMP domain-containing protein